MMTETVLGDSVFIGGSRTLSRPSFGWQDYFCVVGNVYSSIEMVSFSLHDSSDLLTRLRGESRPLIFISAVSRELRSARQLVANTLTFLGYDPIWQDIFETSEGDLRSVLRSRSAAAKAWCNWLAAATERSRCSPPRNLVE